MSLKAILAPVIALDEDQAALTAAAELAEKFDARPVVLILGMHLASTYMDQAAPLSAVLDDIAEGASSHAARLRSALAAWVERAPRAFEVRDLSIEHAVDDDKISALARLADLVVVARAEGHARARRALIEDVLFKSGRPTLIVPEGPPRRRGWEKIVIGWNDTPEAVRAVMGAFAFLVAAKVVVVATVDAKSAAADERPGHSLTAYLRDHGVAAELHNIDGLGRTEAKALLDDATALDADLLVVGAYGHSRVREFLFGGVTRELLAGASIPLLMTH